MDNDRIDFSPLDPKRDATRFKRMVDRTVAGVRSAVLSPSGLVHQLVVWGRAAVATSALLAVAAWLPALFEGGLSSAPSALRRGDPIELVSQWAKTGKVPSEIDPVDALGDLDVH
jgi:hypothetical protein